MSYLSDWKNHRITATQFLAKSVIYLKEKVGLSVSDSTVDLAHNAANAFIDTVETLTAGYLATHLPQLPAVLATQIAARVANDVEQAISAAANTIKAPEAAADAQPAA